MSRSSSSARETELLERVQKRVMRMQGLEYLSCEERLKQLELFSWKDKLRGISPMYIHTWSTGSQRHSGSSVEPRDRTRGSRCKQTQKALPMRVTDLWHRLLREVTGCPFLEIFKSNLNMTLIKLMGKTGWYPTSAILWYCEICPKSEMWICDKTKHGMNLFLTPPGGHQAWEPSRLYCPLPEDFSLQGYVLIQCSTYILMFLTNGLHILKISLHFRRMSLPSCLAH